jgi:hypothetical protein
VLSTRKIPLPAAVIAGAILLGAFNLSAASPNPNSESASTSVQAWVGARIIDGTGKPAMENATLVIRNGHVEAVGKRVKVPAGAERIDATGKTIIPGLINAHGHLNSEDRLGVYLRDGITTILSLGGDREFALRDFRAKAPAGTVPRLYVAGPIQDSSAIPGAVAVTTPEQARKSVDELIRNKPDIIKVRVDDFRGARQKMSPEVYAAVIDEAHKHGFRTAAHIVFLDDAKGVLRAGVDYIAHSVRDREVDEEFIRLMKERHAFYSPTLTRELAVFIYSETPSFFSDPFFLKEADPAEITQMRDPKRQDAMKTFVIDHEVVGPDVVVKFVFTPNPTRGFKDRAEVRGQEIVFPHELEGKNGGVFSELEGTGTQVKDYDFRIENLKTGAGVRFTSDQPL